MIPRVRVRKQDGNTGVVRPGIEGILAIIAAASAGPVNVAAAHNDQTLAQAEFAWGPLADEAAYVMPETGNPVLLVRPVTSTVGAYGAVTKVGGGTAAPAATAATNPYDDFNVVVTFLTAGALGTAGITYQTSIDGGVTQSAVQQLGTALILTIPDTGISITLGTATQTIFANEVLTFTTTRPLATSADLPASLEALRSTTSPFEAVLIDTLADATTVGLVATWLLDLNDHGRFPVVFMTFRPIAAGESEATYAAAFATAMNTAACVDIVFCADKADMVSAFRGVTVVRPAGFSVAARSMAVPIGTEPAFVDLGPLTGVRITDARNNTKHHNEEKFPTLDTLRATTLRTIEGYEGVYITNTNLLSPSGSDYVYLPHARTMNAAASIAFQRLTKQLSRGVPKNPKAGPNGERYIADHAASLMEALVQTVLDRALKGQVDDIKFSISRTDDISSNGGAVLTCTVESVSLAYVKQFNVYERFVKQLSPAPAAQ